jgi:hypothetical protein
LKNRKPFIILSFPKYMSNLVSEVIEQLRKLDRANYPHLVREREIRRRKRADTPIPCFKKIVDIYLRSQQIKDSLMQGFSNSRDTSLAYATMMSN